MENMTFADLGLSDAMLKVLEKKGYGYPTTIQAEAIPHFMQWKDVIAKAPTGTGKTFAFGIPMIEHIDASNEAVQALILAPTRELAIQIGDELRGLLTFYQGIRVAVLYGGQVVELGTCEEVFYDPRHPYTEGLFNSLPNIKDRKAELKPIPGLMPDPANLPEGCAFADRCSYATDACRAKQPEKRWISDTHMVACTAYDDPNFMIERSRKP